MNNQYNPQQPAPQQTTSTQTVQQAAPQQNYQQPNQQVQYQQQYQQPYQQAYAPRPPKPRIDPAIANKQKKDAIEAFGDKLSALMNTNPILGTIAKFADIISYGVTGICVLFTIIALIASNVNMIVLTLNLGGEIGGCFIFSILAVIFGGLSLCKKKMLPLTVSLSAVSALLLTRFIVNIVTFATLGSLASEMSIGSSGAVPGGIVINFIFLIFEMLAVGFLTYICWTYFLATLPPKPVMQQPYQQPYNPQQQNMQQNYQQPVAPMQNPVQQAAPVQPVAPQQAPVQQAAPVQPVAPQQAPVQQAVSASIICPNCQTVNGADSLFCQKCGTKLK